MPETVRIKGIRRNDRIASAVILCLLAGIAALIFMLGRRGPVEDAFILTGEHAPLLQPPRAFDKGLTLTRTVGYNADTLYEYINGEAPRYMQFGFQELTVAEYQGPGGSPILAVDLYDMGARRNAYGIFVDGRGGEAEQADFGNEGYHEGNLAAFWKGRFFVRVRALTEGDFTETVGAAAVALAAWIDDPIGGLEQFASFPQEGLADDARSFQREAAFGLAYINNAFVAEYRNGEERYQLFLIETDSPEAASAILQEHAQFLQTGGALEEERAEKNESFLWGRERYIGPTWFMTRGARLAGSLGISDKAQAEKLVRGVLDRAEKVTQEVAEHEHE